MRQLSLLVTTALVLAVEAKNVLNPKGPPCPDGDGLYAVGCNSKYLQCVNNVEFEQSCPEGLFFDRLMSRCERRSVNHLCNEENRKTLNVRQKAVAINCVGRLSGDYPLDKSVCNENYYQCANGISYMRKCPHNQVYSPILKRCDYASNCRGSDGVKLYAAAAYASPTYDADNFVVTTKEFENGHRDINCTVVGDLYFTNDGQCSPYFWQCSNGKLFRKTCPEGLIYRLSQNLCDYPQGVKECPEYDGSETAYEPAPTTTSAPYAPPATSTPRYETPVDPVPAPTPPAYIPPVAPFTMAPTPPTSGPQRTPTIAPYVPAAAPSAPVYSQPISYQPAIHGDCQGKEDGFFEIKQCHSEFLTCAGGNGRVISCANDLVYDARTSACDFLEACKGPRKQEDIPVLYNHGGALDEKPVEAKVDFDCSGKVNGEYFKEACTKNYFRCQDGRAFAASCPADLVYNKATATCDYADNCEKNYMEPSQLYEKPTTTAAYQPPVTYTTQPPTTTGYTQPPTQRPSTVYARPIYTTEPTTVGYEEPSTTVYSTTQAPVTLPISLDDFSCARLIDGNHASGLCKNIFFTCSNNQVTATKCPGNLVFNPYQGQCDYERNVRDCQGYQPAETTTASYSQPQTSTSGYYPVKTTTKRHVPSYAPTSTPGYAPTSTPGYAPTTQAPIYVPVTYATTERPTYAAFCERLGDGNYGHECENYFFKCYNFETFKYECPAGLYYSLKRDQCDHKENVEGCPGYTPTTTPAAEQPQTPKYGYKADNYPNIDYTTTTPGPVDTTPIAEAFSCYGRPDGIYALPYCSKDYVQCIHGRSLVASCASGLFYSEMTGLCDYKNNVDICKIRKGSDSIDNNACLGKADGYYSAGCSSHYFSCIDEQIRKMSCPNKLKFSQTKGRCTYPTDVSECSIAANPERTPPAVPSDFCTIRPNGLHAFKTCSPHYIVCDNSKAIAGTCAAPLVFNGQNQLCDYKSNNKECGSDYIQPVTDAYSSYTTRAQEQPQTTTTKPYQPQTTPTARPLYKAETTTTRAYQPPSTTTRAYQAPTRTTRAYEAPTTTTRAYEAPKTTTRAYQPPTTTRRPYEAPTTTTQRQTTTSKQYETVATTTPAEDIEVPTTTVGYQTSQETTTTPEVTTAPYVAPSTTAQNNY
uniref:Chitin-binding type-2 domain-containing protein n=1 Tax=Caenorhabditis tropicalis TaxID=1561998 RepID=A0A1I7USJ8_9PELO